MIDHGVLDVLVPRLDGNDCEECREWERNGFVGDGPLLSSFVRCSELCSSGGGEIWTLLLVTISLSDKGVTCNEDFCLAISGSIPRGRCRDRGKNVGRTVPFLYSVEN